MFRQTLLFAFFYLALVCDKFPRYIDKNFGNISFEQFIFHMTAAEGAPTAVVLSTLNRLVVEPVLFAALFMLLIGLTHRFWAPSVARWLKRLLVALSLVLMALGLIQTAYSLELADYIDAQLAGGSQGDWMVDLYQTPKPIAGTEPPKNLILVYVESLENHRVKESSSLKVLLNTVQAQQFSIMPGTQWTLAGLVASQCGVPLFPVRGIGGNRYDLLDQAFLPHAICLGDVLKQAGYTTEYLGGAKTAFAGKDKFLMSHGFDRLIGREELAVHYPQAEYPVDWWGYSDDVVYDFAKQRLRSLQDAQTPFFFSLLTLDTHGPKGLQTPYCRDQQFSKSVDDIFACAVAQLEDFAQWLDKEGFMRNSVVVVMGDHPFMAPQYRESLIDQKWRSLSSRDVFFGMSVPGQETRQMSDMNHFDVMPTVLGAMGFGLENHRAGLGRNAMTPPGSGNPALPENFRQRIRQSSTEYVRLWEDRSKP